MKHWLIALGALLSVGAAPATDSSQTAEITAANRVRADVEFLADDLLEGRDTGSRGHAVGAVYVASQFRALGLQPGGERGGWYQQVPLRTATLANPAPAAELIGRAGRRPLTIGKDLVVGATVQEQQQDITAPLVFAGYGISAPALGIDDYRGLDVRGKIAVIFEGTPAGLPTEVAAHLQVNKDQAAAKNGAVGVIQIPTRASDKSVVWQYLLTTGNEPVTDWVDVQGGAGSSPAGLKFSILAPKDGAEALFAGAKRSYARLLDEAARAGSRPRGFALAQQFHLTRNSRWQDFSSPEVIGLLPGSDPKLRHEYVVLMGHLDHLGIKKDAKPSEDAINNGALDNAAGVATMLEAARKFVESGQPPRRSVLFIANTGEEKGLLGADYFARHATVPIGQIVGLVDLDMPMLLYDFTDVVAFGAEHSTVARTIADAARQMNVAVSPDPFPEQSIFVRSDHYRFVLQGVPAILLMTGFANGGKAVWDRWLPSIYHSPKDDLAQPINWRAGARYAELNYRISRALADADARPLWYKGDFFGDTFAPGQARAER